MAQTYTGLGRLKVIDRGEYSATTKYEELDIVSYNNIVYFAKAKSIPVGTLPTNTTYFTCLGGVYELMTSSELQTAWANN